MEKILPPEIWIKIFKYLSTFEYAQLIKTCQFFRKLIRNYHFFWEKLNFRQHFNWNEIIKFIECCQCSIKEITFPLNVSENFKHEVLVLKQMPCLERYFMIERNVWVDLNKPFNHILDYCIQLKELHLFIPHGTIVNFELFDTKLKNLKNLHLSNMQEYVLNSVCFFNLSELRLEFAALKHRFNMPPPFFGPNVEILCIKNCDLNLQVIFEVYFKLVDIKLVNCHFSGMRMNKLFFKTLFSTFENTLRILHMDTFYIENGFANIQIFEILGKNITDLRFIYTSIKDRVFNCVYHISKIDNDWIFNTKQKILYYCNSCMQINNK